MLFAYIDRALGSMLLQAMAGAIFAALVMGRKIFVAPFAWIHSRNSVQNASGDSQEMPTRSSDP